MRIITDNVGTGENHGCPYRHHDPNALRELLVKSGLEGDALKEVLQLAKDGHCQKACGTQFKVCVQSSLLVLNLILRIKFLGLTRRSGIVDRINDKSSQSILHGKRQWRSFKLSRKVKAENGESQCLLDKEGRGVMKYFYVEI